MTRRANTLLDEHRFTYNTEKLSERRRGFRLGNSGTDQNDHNLAMHEMSYITAANLER